jgi:hypothetical protein
LTFGDRPFPATATVAMYKTVELREVRKPKATEAIKENTYMDDVCDSQASVADAKELISNIDEVLDAGGFSIKEWISNAPLSDKESRNEVVLEANEETNVQKVIGTVWHPKQVQFSFALKIEYPNALFNEATPSKMPSKLQSRPK